MSCPGEDQMEVAQVVEDPVVGEERRAVDQGVHDGATTDESQTRPSW